MSAENERIRFALIIPTDKIVHGNGKVTVNVDVIESDREIAEMAAQNFARETGASVTFVDERSSRKNKAFFGMSSAFEARYLYMET